MNKRRPAVAFIMVTLLIDVIGIGLIIPILPILVGQFTGGRQAQAEWYGWIAAAYGATQFLCAPLLGALSDRFGRRPLLLLGIAGLGTTFLLTALAPSLWVILLARVLGGGLSANFAVAQAYVADITAPEQRTRSLGMLGAMFGVGFVLGPMLGGVLGGIELRLPLYAAAGMCVLNWLYGLLVLPESLAAERRQAFSFKRANPLAALGGVGRLQGIGALVYALGFSLFAQLMTQFTWVLYTTFKFGWGPRQAGLSLFVVGLVAVVVQGGLLGRLIKLMGERRLIIAGLLSGSLAYAGYGLATHGWMMYALICANFLAFASGVALQGMVSKAAGAEEQGRTMGALASLSSLLGIPAPIIANTLLGEVSHLASSDWRVGAPFFLCAAMQASAWLIAWRHFSAPQQSRSASAPQAGR